MGCILSNLKKPIDTDADLDSKKFVFAAGFSTVSFLTVFFTWGALLRDFAWLSLQPFIPGIYWVFVLVYTYRTRRKYNRLVAAIGCFLIEASACIFFWEPARAGLFVFFSLGVNLYYIQMELNMKLWVGLVVWSGAVSTVFLLERELQFGFYDATFSNYPQSTTAWFGMYVVVSVVFPAFCCYSLLQRLRVRQEKNMEMETAKNVAFLFSQAVASYDMGSANEVLEDHQGLLDKELAQAFGVIAGNMEIYKQFLPSTLLGPQPDRHMAASGVTHHDNSAGGPDTRSPTALLELQPPGSSNPSSERGGHSPLQRKASTNSESAIISMLSMTTLERESAEGKQRGDVHPFRASSSGTASGGSAIPHRSGTSNHHGPTRVVSNLSTITASNPNHSSGSSGSKAAELGIVQQGFRPRSHCSEAGSSSSSHGSHGSGGGQSVSVIVAVSPLEGSQLDSSDLSLRTTKVESPFATKTGWNGQGQSVLTEDVSPRNPSTEDLSTLLHVTGELGRSRELSINSTSSAIIRINGDQTPTEDFGASDLMTRDATPINPNINRDNALPVLPVQTQESRNGAPATMNPMDLSGQETTNSDPGNNFLSTHSPSGSQHNLLQSPSVDDLSPPIPFRTAPKVVMALVYFHGHEMDHSLPEANERGLGVRSPIVQPTTIMIDGVSQVLPERGTVHSLAMSVSQSVATLASVCADHKATIQMVNGPIALVAWGLGQEDEDANQKRHLDAKDLAAKFACALRTKFLYKTPESDANLLDIANAPCAVSAAIDIGEVIYGVVGDQESRHLCVLGPFSVQQQVVGSSSVVLSSPSASNNPPGSLLAVGRQNSAVGGSDIGANYAEDSQLYLMLEAAKAQNAIVVSGALAENLEGAFHFRGIDAVRWGRNLSWLDRQPGLVGAHQQQMVTSQMTPPTSTLFNVVPPLPSFSAHAPGGGPPLNPIIKVYEVVCSIRAAVNEMTGEWMYILKENGDFCDRMTRALDKYCLGHFEDAADLLAGLPPQQQRDKKLVLLEKRTAQCRAASHHMMGEKPVPSRNATTEDGSGENATMKLKYCAEVGFTY